MSSLANVHRFNLRLRVTLCGAVVDDRVVRRPFPEASLSALTGGALPMIPDGARLRWTGATRSELIDASGTRHIGPDAPLVVREGDCEVELSLVPEQRVAPPDGWVDLWLPMLVMLAMILGYFFQSGRATEVAAPMVPEASPELIARLLNNEIAGAQEGLLARLEARPERGQPIDDVFMPAGDAGPITSAGGVVNPAQALRDQIARKKKKAKFQPLKQAPAIPSAGVSPLPSDEPRELKGDAEDGADREAASAAASDRRGYGLEDWYDTEDARRDTRAVAEKLNRAEELVKLDPEASWALLQLAYYQYLSSDYEACRRTYERYIELFPDSPTGYNNLALVFKRLGEYSKEEGYYRLALALEPNDENVMNNLAVNLAHQNRFAEAIGIMDELALRNPDDPYADLHRAKIWAARGDDEKALFYLEKALEGMRKLDTFHHIEFRQDIRVDPAFAALRTQSRFHELLSRYYGEAAPPSDPGGDHG